MLNEFSRLLECGTLSQSLLLWILINLVNMTIPDLAFAYSQLSKFVQYPGIVHLEAAERVLQYVRATYDQGITYCDPGTVMLNTLSGWVDSY